ncbi:MAG: hypothetical protein U5R48_01535 [Gammaproteobacteria bacterium]|nr:hypothetical protein [Gammaproteobacteria bacterium]
MDLENHIAGLDGVAQACVVAQPHPQVGRASRGTGRCSKEGRRRRKRSRCIAHCEEKFAKWQLPDDVLFVDEIPLTATGKMDKKVVRAQLEEDGYQLPDLREKAG